MKFDIGKFWGGRVRFFSLSLKRPAYSKAAGRRTRNVSNSKVFEEGGKFRMLPKREQAKFNNIAQKARNILRAFSVPGFPFISSTIHPVLAENVDRLYAEMNDIFKEFEAAKESLLERLPEIYEEMVRAYRQFSQVSWEKDGFASEEECVETRLDFLAANFPAPRRIKQDYSFLLDDLGAIEKTVGLFTQGEILADAESAAKLELIEAQKNAAKAQIEEFVAHQAMLVRAELLKAIWPIVKRLRDGMAVTEAVGRKVEESLDRVSNFDFFRDKKFAEITADIRKAVNEARAKGTMLSAVQAQVGMEIALVNTANALKDVAAEFDAGNYRLIELDDESGIQEVAADVELVRGIQERIRALVQEVPAEAAEDDSDKRMLEALIGIQKAEYSDSEKATAVGIAERFSNLEIDSPNAAPNEAPEVQEVDEAITRLIELDDVPDSEPAEGFVEEYVGREIEL